MPALTVLAAFVGLLGLLAVTALWRGYVLTVLWGWFVVPTFGLAALALVPAIGVSLIVSFMTHQVDQSKEQEGSPSGRTARSVAQALLTPALALGIGAVVSHFM